MTLGSILLPTDAPFVLRVLACLARCQLLCVAALAYSNCQLFQFQHMWSSPVSTSAESSTCPTGPADYTRQSNGRQFVPQCAVGCVSTNKKSSVDGGSGCILLYQHVKRFKNQDQNFQFTIGTYMYIQNPNLPIRHCAY